MEGEERFGRKTTAEEPLSRLLRGALRTAGIGGWSLDLSTHWMTWTDVCAEIHGEGVGVQPSFDEAMGYWAPDHSDTVAMAIADCAKLGKSFTLEPLLITRAGQKRWVRLTGEAVLDPSGTIVAIDGTIRDRTEDARSLIAEAMVNGARRALGGINQGGGTVLFSLDADCRVTVVSGDIERIFALSEAELIGRRFQDVLPRLWAGEIGKRLRDALSASLSFSFVHLDTAEHKWFDVKVHASPEGSAICLRDITEQLAQRQHLQLLEAAIARQDEIVIVTDVKPIDGPLGPRIVYVNDAFVRLTGYSREEVIGKTPRILQGPRTQRHELDRIRRALESWQPIRAELINYTKDGREFWQELDIVPLADSTGWYTHWVAIQRDVTARKQAEAEFRLQEERFRLVTKATHDVIWDWDASTGELWLNDEFAVQFGPDPEGTDLSLDPWERRLHPDDRDRILLRMREVIEGIGLRWLEEYRFLRWDGSAVHVLDRGFVLRDDNGQVIRMIGSMVDVTERRKLEERLRQSQRLEAIGQLTGGVAHDFNNLLTVILGNAEMLADMLSDQKPLAALAEVIASTAERGAELTYRLLAIARRQALEPRSVDLGCLIGNMEGLLGRTLSENIEIRYVITPDLWPALVDPGQLEVALLNLAINARDAMPLGGNLTFSLSNASGVEDPSAPNQNVGEMVRITVSDTGEGMSPAILERAFDPFFTTKEIGKGSGLGLSMVYGFARQSNGFATIQSCLGEGTAVALYLPRAFAEAEVPHVDLGPGAVQNGTERILVVEDDPVLRQHLCAQLRALGYWVMDAGSGPEALSILEMPTEFDLLFTDIVMPGGMDGRQVAEIARQRRPKLRVLFTSGYIEDEIGFGVGRDSDTQLLRKPYRQEELAGKLRAVLDPKPVKNVRSALVVPKRDNRDLTN